MSEQTRDLTPEQCWATARGFDLKAPHWDDLDAHIRDAVGRAIRLAVAAAAPPSGEAVTEAELVAAAGDALSWIENDELPPNGVIRRFDKALEAFRSRRPSSERGGERWPFPLGPAGGAGRVRAGLNR
jgi:hypothetical protein